MRLYCCLIPPPARVNAQLVDAWPAMSGIAKGMRRTRVGGRTFIVGSSRRDKRSSELRTSAKILCKMQFLVQNRKLCYISALVGSIERRGQRRIEQPAEGRTYFFCGCQAGPQCWKPPSTGLILRCPLPEAKGLEGRSRGRKRGDELDHPSRREASLRSSG